jgi:hypothetical protein
MKIKFFCHLGISAALRLACCARVLRAGLRLALPLNLASQDNLSAAC